MKATVGPEGASEQFAEALLANDRHYVDAVADLGDRQNVLASEDITGSNGIKLVARGTRIDSRLREKLSGHRLPQDLDRRLMAENAVSAASLASEANRQISTEPFWQKIAARSGDALAMRHGLAAVKLPAPLAFKLTVAREQRSALYQHTRRVALLCHYLALRLGMNEKGTHNLLLAAFSHDIGEMHTDPAILDPGHRIGNDEWRFIYVHPITGNLLLRNIAGLPAEVARAVLHHHERLDGSGYPAGLADGQIEPLALPLMVAETADAVLTRFNCHDRLSTLLRLNQSKYDGKSVALLREAVQAQENVRPVAGLPTERRRTQLLAIATLLAEWAGLRSSLEEKQLPNGPDGLGFLQQRLHNLNSLLHQFGFDPGSFETLITLAAADAEVAAELGQVLDELQFQLAEMAREIDRRAADIAKALSTSQQAAFAAWRNTLAQAVVQG